MGTKRSVPPQDKAKFLSLIQAGHSIKEASSMAGVHYNTGSRWIKRLKEAQASREEAQAKGARGKGAGGRQTTDYQAIIDAIDLPSAIPVDQVAPSYSSEVLLRLKLPKIKAAYLYAADIALLVALSPLSIASPKVLTVCFEPSSAETKSNSTTFW